MTTKIDNYDLVPLVTELRSQRKTYRFIADECNKVLAAKGVSDTVSVENLVYYCTAANVIPTGKKEAYRMDDHIQAAIIEARDGARTIINRCNRLLDKQEAAMNPLDTQHVRAFTDIVAALQKSLDQLTVVLNTIKPPVQIFNQRVVQIAEIIAADTRLHPDDKRRILNVIAESIVPITEGDVNERSNYANR